VQPDDGETLDLLARCQSHDPLALEQLLARHRPLLRRFVEMRLDPRLRSRLDPSDIVQEAQLEVTRRLQDFLQRRPMPFRLWLQRTTYENLVRLRRVHVEADRRSVNREVMLPDNSSVLLLHCLLGQDDWPGQQLVEDELKGRVHRALNELDEIDREILQLRAFEELDNDAVAQVLDLEPNTASKRYGRALLRLRKSLRDQGCSDSRD
jgi:RNA polymerase sigma-70 factor (ECF subfamily)